jgi:hypothetical protein
VLLLAGMLAASLGVNLWQSHEIRASQQAQNQASASQRQQIIDAQNAAVANAKKDILGGQGELGHQLNALGLTPANIAAIAEQAASRAQGAVVGQVAGGIKVVQSNNALLHELVARLPQLAALPAGTTIINTPAGPVFSIPVPGAAPGSPGWTCLIRLDSPVLTTGALCGQKGP